MVKIISARIVEGNIVPETALPPAESIRSVSVVVEIADPEDKGAKESTLPRLLGLLKGSEISEEHYV